MARVSSSTFRASSGAWAWRRRRFGRDYARAVGCEWNGLSRLLQGGRIDPTRLTTHTMRFEELQRAFEMMERKLDGIIKPLILF